MREFRPVLPSGDSRSAPFELQGEQRIRCCQGDPMKRLLLSSLAALALSAGSSAFAADLRMPVKAPYAPPPPAITWTGCYVDGGIGYGMWNQDRFGETDPGLVPLTNTFTSGGQGWLGRVGAGCDYQVASSWVIGVFGDYDFMDLQSKNFADLQGVGAIEKESGAWYAGGRIGYLVTPSLLGFVDGGYTQTRFDRQELFDTLVTPAAPLGANIAAHTYSGWFIGGGTEYALNMSWIPIRGLFWRSEYRYAQYQADNLPITLDSGLPTGAGEHSQKQVQTITSGLVWRFNFGGPVAARY
jgi:outer membrane immunogenic protein